MRIEDHELISELIFNNKYTGVHKWLDACFLDYFGNPKFPSVYFHWIERHHIRAIEEKYGSNTKEYQTACLHIICDWISHWGEVHLHRDKQEVAMELSLKIRRP